MRFGHALYFYFFESEVLSLVRKTATAVDMAGARNATGGAGSKMACLQINSFNSSQTPHS